MRLTHVRLLVDDVPACFRFYRDVMGFAPTWGDEGDDYADFTAGAETVLALMSRSGQEEVVQLRPDGESAMLVLESDDLDGERARLSRAGAEPGEITERSDWGIRFFHLRDPAGTLIEVNTQIPMEER